MLTSKRTQTGRTPPPPQRTSDLSRLLVHGVNLELDVSIRHIEHLVVLLEHLRVSLNAGLEPGQRDGHVVTRGSAAALGVEEEASPVGGSAEAAAHLEAGLDLVTSRGGLRHEVLHGEEEGDALVVGLDGGGGVVDAILEGGGGEFERNDGDC